MQVEEDNQISVPHGGPIFIVDTVSSITRVHDFETAAIGELEGLKADLLLWDCSEEDISVNELKIVSEEEFVKLAFEEAFQDNEEIGNSAEVVEDQSHTGRNHHGRTQPICENPRLEGSGALEIAPVSDEPLSPSPPGTCENGEADRETVKKRKRGHIGREKEPTSPPEICNNGESDRKVMKKRRTGKQKKLISSPGTPAIEESDIQMIKKRKKGHTLKQTQPRKEKYIAKVERIVEIKKKQDEEGKAAKLHSLKTNKRANSSSDTTERLRVLKSTSFKTKVTPSDFCEHVPVVHPEVALCIEVYHNKRTWSKNQEFLVLACQRLTELKDRITCLTDELMSKSGSGYFLIEDVFYNDMRDANAVDYSQPIMTWLRDSKEEAIEKWDFLEAGGSTSASQLPHFRTANMDKMRFCDLRFRLGAGYLYCHQGDCKHAIVIRDMRLVHPEDVQNRAAYPLVTYQAKLRFQKCSICNITRAEKVIVDDKWAPENPCYFCPNCYYMLHYVDRKLLYDNFSVYDYIHD